MLRGCIKPIHFQGVLVIPFLLTATTVKFGPCHQRQITDSLYCLGAETCTLSGAPRETDDCLEIVLMETSAKKVISIEEWLFLEVVHFIAAWKEVILICD